MPKPDGFELRDKRSEKEKDAKRWLPADALFDASVEMQKQEVCAAIVCWREVLPDGSMRTHFRFAGDSGQGEALLLNAIGRFMGWQ